MDLAGNITAPTDVEDWSEPRRKCVAAPGSAAGLLLLPVEAEPYDTRRSLSPVDFASGSCNSWESWKLSCCSMDSPSGRLLTLIEFLRAAARAPPVRATLRVSLSRFDSFFSCSSNHLRMFFGTTTPSLDTFDGPPARLLEEPPSRNDPLVMLGLRSIPGLAFPPATAP